MTKDRRAKRATRLRMSETGEKYTDARRARLGDGGGGRVPPPAETTEQPSDDLIGWFTDQAYNLILLAEDEARMLGQTRVEPEHLLLAAARRGNAQRVLSRVRIGPSAIRAAVVRQGGLAADLLLGRIPRSVASEQALELAITAAFDRGILGPSSEHLLLGLAAQGQAMAILRELGLLDVAALVDRFYPVSRRPIGPGVLERRALSRSARKPPSPGPIPPVFERFTAEAHEAVDAAVVSARRLENQYVLPTHLLLGLLGSERGVVAHLRSRHHGQFDGMAAHARELMTAEATEGRRVAESVVDPMRRYSTAPTDIFSTAARRLAAEDVLKVAHRLGHRPLSTGHLLLALVENPDDATGEILGAHASPIVDTVMGMLPGEEHS